MAKFEKHGLGQGLEDFTFTTTFKTTISAKLFDGLKRMTSLRLNGARLNFKPQEPPFSRLKNLTDLHMISLRFHQDPFSEKIFFGLDSLESLTLQQLDVANIQGNALGPLSNLKSLTLQSLKCAFPDDLFSSLNGLLDLAIKKDECYLCPNGKRLMRRSFFQNLTLLQSFEYVGQHQGNESKITEFQPGVFGTNSQLQNLTLSGVQLPYDDLSVFSNLTSLENLVLIAPGLLRFDSSHLKVKALNITLTGSQFRQDNCQFLRNISSCNASVTTALAVTAPGMDDKKSIGSIDSLCKTYDLKRKWLFIVVIGIVLCFIIGGCAYWQRRRKPYFRTVAVDDIAKGDQYDVFVSYANEDSDAAEKIMTYFKETRISYINHQEHFQVGDPIVENIEWAVRSSQMTLIILSEHYLKSSWCIYESETAQTLDKKLAILYRGDQSLSEEHFARAPKLFDIIRTQTYLSETDDFLARLTRVVHGQPVISKYSKNHFLLPKLRWYWFKSAHSIPVSTELRSLD
eukprot:TCALIF_11014-PA protein Name:"Similar to TLR2-2 Toll-like receptor 2 type-2 (Gallus gallus)" AED:0.40 eAED:0.56 QI:0/-1/0/1/-1/1/1/0/513